MNYPTLLTNLYFLLIHADGNVNDKEIAWGQQMIKTENIAEKEFNTQMSVLATKAHAGILTESIASIKKLDREKQIRCIAWLCVIANSDGFMDKKEWQFIYNIYHKELQLPLDEVMKVQKELGRSQRENTPPSILA